ncbi:MAG: ABC transporter ATP-binding protein [Lachnospiraceae bacterium]|nr:ABC transporter ATP-binding protein [Lachnospiraceae bacterium]
MNQYLKGHLRLLAVWLIAEFMGAVMVTGMSLFMKQVADTAYGEDGLEGIQGLLLLGLVLVVVCLAVEYLGHYCRAKFLKECNLSLKRKIFDRIIHCDINLFQEKNNGSYISLLNNDLRLIDESYFQVIPLIYSNINTFLVAFIVMCLYHPLLAALQVLLCIPQILLPRRFGKSASAKQKEYMDSLDVWNAEVKDIFTGFEAVKSFGIEEKIKERYRKIVDEVEKNGFVMRKQQAKSLALSSASLYMAFVLQTVFSVYLVMNGEITMGILLGTMQISNYVNNPVREISELYLEYLTIKPVLARISAVLDGTEEAQGKTLGIEVDRVTPLCLHKLSFAYEDGRRILHELDFRFDSGKKYAIVGSSGSGKSTLLRLLMGYYAQYEGEVYCGGKRQTEISGQSLYRRISMVHQRVFLFDDTIRNNITMCGRYSDEEVWKAAEEAGLMEVIRRMGDGLDSRIQEEGRNLSGGEQQRFAIARAFIRKAQVLLMDEGTASLDYQTAGLIDSLLLDKEGLTLLSVTHKTEKELLQRYDEILVLEQGRILEHGLYDELSEQSKQLLAWNCQGASDDN